MWWPSSLMPVSAAQVAIGDIVEYKGVEVTVRYVGKGPKPGAWIGIELPPGLGSHNGTVQGIAYFECEEGRGKLVQPKALSPIDVAARGESVATPPTTSTTTTTSEASSQRPPPLKRRASVIAWDNYGTGLSMGAGMVELTEHSRPVGLDETRPPATPSPTQRAKKQIRIHSSPEKREALSLGHEAVLHWHGKKWKCRIAYIGFTTIGPGVWYGVILEEEHEFCCTGAYEGKRYFVTHNNERTGLFCRESRLSPANWRRSTKQERRKFNRQFTPQEPMPAGTHVWYHWHNYSYPAVVRYAGFVDGIRGVVYGIEVDAIELSSAERGVIDGVEYFRTESGVGALFCRKSRLRLRDHGGPDYVALTADLADFDFETLMREALEEADESDSESGSGLSSASGGLRSRGIGRARNTPKRRTNGRSKGRRSKSSLKRRGSSASVSGGGGGNMSGNGSASGNGTQSGADNTSTGARRTISGTAKRNAQRRASVRRASSSASLIANKRPSVRRQNSLGPARIASLTGRQGSPRERRDVWA